MKKKVLFSTVLFILLPLWACAQVQDHLVITQIQITGGPGKTTNDFIELYNPTVGNIDLKGYRLVKRTKTGTTDTLIKSWTKSAVIPAGGYYLWANSDFADISVLPNATTSATLADDNGVALRLGANDTGEIIDALAWGAAANAFLEGQVYPENPGANMALKRKTDNGDSNNNAADFEIVSASPRSSTAVSPADSSSAGEQPAPTEENQGETSTPAVSSFNPAALEITELFPNPSGSDSGKEWVEFSNAQASAIDLSGWLLDDQGASIGSSAFTLPAGSIVPAGGLLVVTLPVGKFTLNNTGGDCARLFSADQVLKKELCYTEDAAEESAYARTPDGNYTWTKSPTPGMANQFSESETVYSSGLAVISEILPHPAGDEDEEFIELKNMGSEELDFSGWKISDAKRTYKITEADFNDTLVAPGGFLVLPRTVTRIALNNTGGETVTLFSPDGRKRSEVTYLGSALEGRAYVRDERGNLVWTTKPTPGRENEIISPTIGSGGTANDLAAADTVGKVAGETLAPIALAEVRSLSLGSQVVTSGTVAAGLDILGKNVFYLAGSGMRVFLENDANSTLKPALGDQIILSGELAVYHNERQIKVSSSSAVVVSGHGTVPAAKQISTGDAGESYEGWLVHTAGRVTRTSGNTFYIDDGSGEVQVYIMDSTSIAKPKMRTGDSVVVTGIVSHYDDHFRILPRLQSDLEAGTVLAAETTPRTGLDYWFFVAGLVILELSLFELAAHFLPKFFRCGIIAK
jgi:hypothetical protein